MNATATEPRRSALAVAPSGEPVDKRRVLSWEIAAFLVINLVGGSLHFAFELSNFSEPVAVFASVNESTFEHLKLYFWPALAFAFVQHAYVKGSVNNYWWGKGLAIAVTPATLIVAFYLYLGIVLPIDGKGTLPATITIGMLAVLAGNITSYRLLTAPERGKRYRNTGFAIMGLLTVLMATSAWFPPEFFLYEDFFGYEYTGQYGILEDYTNYLVFTGR